MKKPLRPSGRARNSASLPSDHHPASSIAPPDGAAPSKGPSRPSRSHRWTLDAAARVATCETCRARRVVHFDLSAGRLTPRVTDSGPEKCPGHLPPPPEVATCTTSGARWWWWFARPWAQVALPTMDEHTTCGVQVARAGETAGGLPVAVVGAGWSTVARADDSTATRARKRVALPLCSRPTFARAGVSP